MPQLSDEWEGLGVSEPGRPEGLSRAPATADGVGRVRVLIAEDDPVLREVIIEVIRGEPSFELAGAVADAEAAIEAARAALPDVAVVDVRMPRGGGAAATRGIRDVSARTRVIALSGHNDDSIAAEMFEAGVCGFLIKGGTIEEIVRTIRAAASGSLDRAV